MAGPLRATLFVARQNGDLVPLVAVDELPFSISITGTPHLLGPQDLTGMTCIGPIENRQGRYALDRTYVAPASRATPSDGNILRAKFFASRNTGTLTPLIAMDEMPLSFVLEGVPRVVDTMSMIGMTCVGTFDTRPGLHTFTDVNRFFRNEPVARDRSSMQSLAIAPPALAIAPPTFAARQSAAVPPARPSTPTVAVTGQNAGPTGGDTAPNSGKLGRKVYCSYWLRKGECDYMQQGCLFKHEMPQDLKGLEAIGLRDFPKWYRDQEGIGSFLAASGAGASFSGPDMRSAVAAGRTEGENNNRLTQNWRTPAGRGQATGRAAGNRRATQASRGGARNAQERMSSVHQPLERLPTDRRDAITRAPSDEQSVNTQNLETITALNAIDQSNAASVSEFSAVSPPETREGASTEEAGLSPSEHDEQALFTPDSASEAPTVRFPEEATLPFPPERRSLSIISVASDIEAFIFRTDAARRAQQDRDFQMEVDARAREAAVENARLEMEARATNSQASGRRGRGRRDSISSSGGMRSGRGRGERGWQRPQ